MKMKFGLTNIKMVLSILFIFISIIGCLTSFSIFLRHLNTTSAALKEEMTMLHKSFEEGLPAMTMPSSSSSSSSHLQRLQQEITLLENESIVSPIDDVKNTKCISTSNNTNSVTYRFQPSTKYKQSATMPQWMKGKANSTQIYLKKISIIEYESNQIDRCVAFYFSCYGISLSLSM
jgi:hypothetical protein